MNYRIFSLPAVGDETAELSLNGFLLRNKVIQIDRQFVDQGDLSYVGAAAAKRLAAIDVKTLVYGILIGLS